MAQFRVGSNNILNKYCIRATITIDEDFELNKARLSSSMPDRFFKNGDQEFFNEPLARYIAAGLRHQLDPLPEGMLWYQVP